LRHGVVFNTNYMAPTHRLATIPNVTNNQRHHSTVCRNMRLSL